MKPNSGCAILGIDPGSITLGYGLVQGSAGQFATLLECGVIRPPQGESLSVRLQTIFDGVTTLLTTHKPEVVAVENVFHGRFARSALILGHARGVVLLAISQAGCQLSELSPREVKRAVTGTGRATKDQVGAMVARHLRLREIPQPADAADGVAIALTELLRRVPRARLGGGAS